MPSLEHEAPLEVIRQQPDVVADLLRRVLPQLRLPARVTCALGSPISDSTPATRATQKPDASADTLRSNSVLPIPGSPRTTKTALRPLRAFAMSRLRISYTFANFAAQSAATPPCGGLPDCGI